MNKYFVDTSFIIAYSLESDYQHNKALKYKNILKNYECYINNNIITEAITVTYKRTNDIGLCNEIFFKLCNIFNIINEYEIKNYNFKSYDIFNNSGGRLSFTDSGIITTMKHHNIKKLLTFDKQFKKVPKIEIFC